VVRQTEFAVLIAAVVVAVLIVLRVTDTIGWGTFVLSMLTTMVVGTAVDLLEKRIAAGRSERSHGH
jgi:UPF0716 family protein affecting phage T7 exclusion